MRPARATELESLSPADLFGGPLLAMAEPEDDAASHANDNGGASLVFAGELETLDLATLVS